jgi:hypothetical protein
MQIGNFIDRLAKTKFTFAGVYCCSRPTWEERALDVIFEIGQSTFAIVRSQRNRLLADAVIREGLATQRRHLTKSFTRRTIKGT